MPFPAESASRWQFWSVELVSSLPLDCPETIRLQCLRFALSISPAYNDTRSHVEMFPGHHQLPEGSMIQLKKILHNLAVGPCPIFYISCPAHSPLPADNLSSESSTTPFDERRIDKYLDVVKSLGSVSSAYLRGSQLKYTQARTSPQKQALSLVRHPLIRFPTYAYVSGRSTHGACMWVSHL